MAKQLESLPTTTVYRDDTTFKESPCSGIIIADRNLNIGGIPNKCAGTKFQGVILALGGTGGMVVEGVIFAGHIVNNGSAETPKYGFGQQSFIAGGDGNFNIKYDGKYFGNNSNTESTDTLPTSAKILSWKDIR